MAIEKLGKYEINLEPIGKGANSEVFQGFDSINYRKVAIKKFRKIKVAKQEADIMSEYGYHKALPEFFDYFVFEKYGYTVMELIEGNRLGDNYKLGVKYEENKVVQITIDILEGLEHIHKRGILHTDIHPHNILITKAQDEIKIVDFEGAVRKEKDGVCIRNPARGMRGYMPPELRENPSILDDSTDLYATACICISLLTGELPLRVNVTCKKIGNIELRKGLLKAMEIDKNKRYSSAQEFIEILKPFS